jgi:AcrR family transcriptional regulator
LTAAGSSSTLLTIFGKTTGDWQTKRRSATRQAILDAAWEVAREHGLAALTLREVAARVGMRAPSLYSHFDSKHAIYDAMFVAAWTQFEAVIGAVRPPGSPRALLRAMYRAFFDFATADLARHQLMNIRTVPDFRPSRQGYAPAVRVYERMRRLLADIGVHEQADLDLFTAIIGGLVDQQWANDPGGERWARLVDRAAEMFADEMGLPREAP